MTDTFDDSPFGPGVTFGTTRAATPPRRKPLPPIVAAAANQNPIVPATQPMTPTPAATRNLPGAAGAVTQDNSGYQRLGVLTSKDLFEGEPHQFDHLQPAIDQARTWVQSHIKNTGRSEEVAEARMDMTKRAQMASEIDRLLAQYIAKAEKMPRGRDAQIVIAATLNEVLGLGPIEPLWADPDINEIMVNGPDQVYVEIRGRNVLVPGCNFRDRKHLQEVCSQILAPTNRRCDQKSPLADGRLPDGSRVNVVHHAVGPSGPFLTIRRHTNSARSLVELVNMGSVTEEMACLLAWLVYYRASSVVCGGTGSGKTTLLNALSFCINPAERIVTIEDSLELRLNPKAQVLPMEARPESAAGGDAVTIRQLVKNALRMKPTRIIVGEVRDESASDMLTAMNTGHEGSMTTVHANSASSCISALTAYVARAGEIPAAQIKWLIGSACDLIVMQRRYEDGSRRVQGIYEVPSPEASSEDNITPIPLWEWEQTGFDEDGMFVGHYVKKADISEEMFRRLRLDQFPMFTPEDLRRVCRGLPPTTKAQEN